MIQCANCNNKLVVIGDNSLGLNACLSCELVFKDGIGFVRTLTNDEVEQLLSKKFNEALLEDQSWGGYGS